MTDNILNKESKEYFIRFLFEGTDEFIDVINGGSSSYNDDDFFLVLYNFLKTLPIFEFIDKASVDFANVSFEDTTLAIEFNSNFELTEIKIEDNEDYDSEYDHPDKSIKLVNDWGGGFITFIFKNFNLNEIHATVLYKGSEYDRMLWPENEWPKSWSEYSDVNENKLFRELRKL